LRDVSFAVIDCAVTASLANEVEMAVDTAQAHSSGMVSQLARWVAEIRPDQVPDAALRQAKLLVLDALGCGIAAVDEPVPRAALELVETSGGAPQATLMANGAKTSLANAVLANGTLIRALDLNDYVDRDHPSDNIPAALAAGEMQSRSGRETLAAIVVGYELYGRLKHLIPLDSAWDGTTISGLAAAAMAGRLMRLPAGTLAHGFALSLARSATSALARFGAISSLKALANPLVAQNAVQALLLAQLGATGPLQLFESRRGFGAVFSRREAMADLLRPFPAQSYIMSANVKAHPALVTGQAAVDAALSLRARLGPAAAGVRHVRIVMNDVPAVRIQQEDRGRWDPQSREAADHCFQFLVAVTLIDGEFSLAQYENERWNDPQVRALMARMDLGLDAALGARAPQGAYPCALHAVAADGEHAVEALAPSGFSRGGLDEAVVTAKFHRLARSRLPAGARAAIVQAALALDEAGGCGPLFAALREAWRAAAS
jgi:2-methylcitrate dehydratase